jgi:hypothetical protein
MHVVVPWAYSLPAASVSFACAVAPVPVHRADGVAGGLRPPAHRCPVFQLWMIPIIPYAQALPRPLSISLARMA